MMAASQMVRVERSAAHAKALGLFESVTILARALGQEMPSISVVRDAFDRGGDPQRSNSTLPTAEQQRGYAALFLRAAAALEESAAAAEVYQEVDAAFRLGAGKTG